jgi:hypothetical protein
MGSYIIFTHSVFVHEQQVERKEEILELVPSFPSQKTI